MATRPAAPISLTPPPRPEQPTGMSPATRQAIAIVALLLCLVIGVGIIYWFLHGPSNHTITVDPKAQTMDNTARQAMRIAPRRPQQAITKNNDTTWTVIGHTGNMRVQSVNGAYRITLHYNNSREVLSHDQITLVSGIVRARGDEAMAKEWGITPDQIAQLKKIDLNSGLQMSSDERTELQTLWAAYIGAGNGTPKADAEKKVVARVDEIAKTELDASRKALISKIDDFKKILTPDQIDKITQH